MGMMLALLSLGVLTPGPSADIPAFGSRVRLALWRPGKSASQLCGVIALGKMHYKGATAYNVEFDDGFDFLSTTGIGPSNGEECSVATNTRKGSLRGPVHVKGTVLGFRTTQVNLDFGVVNVVNDGICLKLAPGTTVRADLPYGPAVVIRATRRNRSAGADGKQLLVADLWTERNGNYLPSDYRVAVGLQGGEVIPLSEAAAEMAMGNVWVKGMKAGKTRLRLQATVHKIIARGRFELAADIQLRDKPLSVYDLRGNCSWTPDAKVLSVLPR